VTTSAPEISKLIERLRKGESELLHDLFAQHEERLKLMMDARMPEGLKSDESKSIILEKARRKAEESLAEYIESPSESFYVWLRRHAGASVEEHLKKHESAPSEEAESKSEDDTVSIQFFLRKTRKERLLDMEDLEAREAGILALRHFEQLDNKEVAEVLEITPAEASRSYVQALKKLNKILLDKPRLWQQS
jgi:RNA polymerase sigma-70 factor (ECF subfamily)